MKVGNQRIREEGVFRDWGVWVRMTLVDTKVGLKF
jgi:hypothetical protein